MAAYFLQFKPFFGKYQRGLFIESIGVIRHASKSGTEVVATKDHGVSPLFGIKKHHGEVVKAGTVLHKDNKLTYAPGLNVGIGKVVKLYAKTAGKVILSCEKANLDPEAYLVKKRYPSHLPAYKKYIHVIPEPQHRRFVLVESF